MSRGSRIAIGIAALLSAAAFLKSAFNPVGLPTGAMTFYAMALFCGIIAMACFFPKGHPVTLRIIGSVILGSYITYVCSSFGTPNFGRSVIGLFMWGIPSGYLAIKGKYPSWGFGSAGFNANERKNTRK
ncbi:hypothetical protein [Chamaesiphon polymorphus]|nr:hypothetical protein [Chamaesiphon polymorphus]